ncbi:acyl-CoA thioesterase domain-containing protein [Saccharopolyspora mangrovi]|uniref:Thioesterase family protein n=1 Tax=Saccharopolyspora mangrovi TaxID=3082379 RepID=A0ABU6AFT8_9PSEU|nr:acyl-CoA thioesterase domain-containing protein [Saccharopolyspora sp. S2-29]MEB3370401.1 thioesterase family protein [Saccharopolyspora sp. S2-29]
MVDIPGEPFFRPDGDLLVPGEHASSPWSPQMMHGRLFGGLLARSLELEHGAEDFQFARLTVDLFRSATLEPVRVETQRVRDGRRIRVADATVFQGEKAVARASAVLLRRGDQPEGEVPTTPPWSMPGIAELGSPPDSGGRWEPPFDIWMLDESGATADWSHGGARRAWIRDTHDLVAGETMTPFVRTATAADFASPLANMPKGGALGFINADYTLTLSRMPTTPEVGMEATGHLSDTGVATASTTFHDSRGPFGYCNVTAVSTPPLS